MSALIYKAIEDNGGGLHLFVFDGGKAIYAHSDYEHNKGQLSDDIQALKDGSHPSEWDGCEDNPQKDYDWFMGQESFNYAIVADNDGIYPDSMGGSAKYEFGID